MNETVALYYDKSFEREAVKILPGQYYAAQRDMLIVTVLGSCVSACLWDPVRRIGGMNHFMLPGSTSGGSDSARMGVYAMELLINRMLKLGADRSRLVAKVFGGASVLEGMDTLNVGTQNSDFVLEFLRDEGIAVAAQDLYDVCPRKVYFFVDSGKVRVKKLGSLRDDSLQQRERDYLRRLQPHGGEVEIFGSRK
jgi:chemotaxis protein CheD